MTNERTTLMKIFFTSIRRCIVLSWYDFKTKHPNGAVNILWNYIPVIGIYLSTFLFFSKIIGNQPSHFTVSLAVGIVSWNYLRESTTQASVSYKTKWMLVKNLHISKPLFHCFTLLSSTYSYFINLIISLSLLYVFDMGTFGLSLMFFYYSFALFVILLAINLLVSSISTIYRDGYHIWAIILQFGFWITPVFYTMDIIPVEYRSLYLANPINVIFEGLKSSTSTYTTNLNNISAMFSVICILLVSILVANKQERRVVENI